MNDRPLRPIRPGGHISASEFNRAMDRLDQLDFSGGGATDELGQVQLFDQTAPRITIKILSGSNPYDWEEVYQSAAGVWTATGNRSGTATSQPAVERTGNAGIPTGTIVEAVYTVGPDGDGQWQFTLPSVASVAAPTLSYAWQSIQTADFNADVRKAYPIDQSGGTVQGTLPSTHEVNDRVLISVTAYHASNTARVITSGGDKLNGQISTSDAMLGFGHWEFIWTGDATVGWSTSRALNHAEW